MCKKECKESQDPKLQMLKTIIAEQSRTLQGYTEYSFEENIQGKEEFLPERMKKMRFMEIASPKELEKFGSVNITEWSTVNIEVDEVYALMMYIACSLYALSVEAKFLEGSQDAIYAASNKKYLELLKEIGEPNPPAKAIPDKAANDKANRYVVSHSEHWLSRALELSHRYIPNTSLFFQIKNVYSSLYGNRVEQEVIREVSEDY